MARIENALLVLRPRPWKWVRILITSLLFVAAGVFMRSRVQGTFDHVMAWATIVFFGLLALVAIAQFLPGVSEVLVTDRGLRIRSLGKRTFIAWPEIERFGVAEFRTRHGPFAQKHRQIGIRYVAGSAHLSKYVRASALSEAIVGYHGALPDNYGYAHQDLADLLNRHLEAFRTHERNAR